jgi:hypothetical protein
MLLDLLAFGELADDAHAAALGGELDAACDACELALGLWRGEPVADLDGWSAETAGEAALQQWGWTLACDPEGPRHWRPRARGVGIDSERGYRFRGRAAALGQIAGWLYRDKPDRRVLVVTGSPGVGKSAVLGRIVTTADAAIRASLPPGDQAVCASVGSVGCAVHAKAKTALEVAEEIARAASARLPEEPSDLAPAIRDALEERGGRRFNVIIDALDEAASPVQVRAIVDQVCPVTVAGRPLLTTADGDGTVRIWDPGTGRQRTAWRASCSLSTAYARSLWPDGSCWPAPTMTARCGSGIPRRGRVPSPSPRTTRPTPSPG